MLKRLTAFILTLSLLIPALFSCQDKTPQRVLLISIDGLRADAVANTEYGKYLIENSAYSLEVTTVSPSITLPCHMSMFHSVTPDSHGVTSNVYTPKDELGYGITEVLTSVGKSSAIFYNWREIGHLVTEGSTEIAQYIAGETEGWEQANQKIGDACLEHITSTPADFTFLYLGFLDEWGHKYGWLSDEYYYALNESFALVEEVAAAALEQNYTVIITTDHGGHDKGHGSDMKEDMTIPLFILGESFTPGENLGKRSILDVAPTVLNILDLTPPTYWQGTAIE